MSLRAQDRDPSVDPGVDFFRHANGGWLDANPIPPEYGAWGAIEELNVRNEDILHGLLERASSDPQDDIDALIGDFFAAGMDTEAIEAAGIEPIRHLLDRVAGLTDIASLPEALVDLHGWGVHAFFGAEPTPDFDDSDRYLLWVAQAGLGLPDRDAYSLESEAAESLRSAYVEHVAAQLRNAGEGADRAGELARQVFELERQLAELHLRKQDLIDPSKTLNRHDLDALAALAPELDLPRYLQALGAGDIESVNVQNPGLVSGLWGIVEATDLEVVRAYLTFTVVRTVASALPSAFEDEAFDFYGRRVGGQAEMKARWKRVLGATTEDLGDALAQKYVEVAFPPEAKERALAMVDDIVAEMRRSLEQRPWMSEETRARGLVKLDALRVKIGHPDEWRDWSGLELDRSSFATNRLRANRFSVQRGLRRLHEPVDRTEFLQPPHIVNAYYHPILNEIVFPAGILQPPFFDAAADDALNYGAIGAVIAHEITHGFDTNGRRYDFDGAYRDWWTEADEKAFIALADRLAEQFDEYEILEGVNVNGRLTLGENIADLGGVAIAERAHARVSVDTPEIDGLTPAQRFYLAYATIWRSNISDELARTYAQVDPHSPRHLRVLGPLSNSPGFAAAFGLDDDAPMMRPAEERIEIW